MHIIVFVGVGIVEIYIADSKVGSKKSGERLRA